MRIAVVGLWHLGTVTASCLAAAGHEVTAIDEDSQLISELRKGKPPIEEPGLPQLVEAQIQTGRLRFSSQLQPVSNHDVVWVTLDTPIDQNDIGDVDYVFGRSLALLPLMANDGTMLISSQIPVGTVARLERSHQNLSLGNRIRFAYSPENLRLGKAIETFMKPDRVVVGIRSAEDRERLQPIWWPLTDRVEWMSVESAEMTKHAINTFLAMSIAFANEVARICEEVGADALEVERGLKSDLRIGQRAYLRPGAAFAGGTLARDLTFLREIASRSGLDPALLDGIRRSNELHQNWLKSRFTRSVGTPRGKKVAILGLTYKPGTNSLRRSNAVEICRWLSGKGASVSAYDPAIPHEMPETAGLVKVENVPEKILRGADVLIVATEWPEFGDISPDVVTQLMNTPIVIDPSGHLERNLGQDPRITYYSVGRGR